MTAGAPAATLDARYGRSPRSPSRRRLLLAIVAVVSVAVFIGWIIWAGLLGSGVQLEARDTGHVIVSDSLVQVRFDLSVDPGAKVGCAIEGLNESFTVVGWKVVDVPASEQRTRSLSESVRTSEQAVTGLIYRCWLE
jgi:Domain of unknown function (DUF4307)